MADEQPADDRAEQQATDLHSSLPGADSTMGFAYPATSPETLRPRPP
jgi:hypothetical protein